MFVLINGSFGIGKTTVAALLAASVPGARVYDPERIGALLHRLPPRLLGRARQPDDFQELRLWHRLIGPMARWQGRGAPIVIIPMAFSNLRYLDDFAASLAKSGRPVHRICLVAPLAVIRARLEGRGAVVGTAGGDWAFRRAAECVEAHQDPAFGQPVDATESPAEITATIRGLIGLR